jgi:outer membrane protein assembly factor BamA
MLERRVAAAALLALTVVSVPVSGQETRAEVLARERAEKAKQLKPYTAGKIERAMLYFERNNPLERFAPRNGFFVEYGYTGKPVGSGIAFGGGWRHDLFDRNGRIVLEAGHSLRSYRMVRADFSLPRLLDERLELGVEASYYRNPQEDFYGIGRDTIKEDRTSFLYKAPEVQGRVVFTPTEWFNTGLRVARTAVSIDRGTDKRFPSIEERFTEPEAPGLLDDPAFLSTDLFATVDTRDQPGNARAGGYYGLLWRRYNDSDLDRYSFDRVDLDLQHFVPIFDKKRVLAGRVQLLTTTANDDNEVPFYYRPTLGGSDTLRSFADFRFRDRNVLSMNVEYRWEAFSGLDMALFTDWGSVAPRFSDLELAGEKAYGIGLRFNTYKAVFLRFDVAGGGSEGIRYFLKFRGAF